MKIKVTTEYKDLEKTVEHMNKVFEEIDKVFTTVENRLSDPAWRDKTNAMAKWEPYTSWIPRKIGRRWYWHSPIYRKYQLSPGGGFYKYGTEFDVLKESK